MKILLLLLIISLADATFVIDNFSDVACTSPFTTLSMLPTFNTCNLCQRPDKTGVTFRPVSDDAIEVCLHEVSPRQTFAGAGNNIGPAGSGVSYCDTPIVECTRMVVGECAPQVCNIGNRGFPGASRLRRLPTPPGRHFLGRTLGNGFPQQQSHQNLSNALPPPQIDDVVCDRAATLPQDWLQLVWPDAGGPITGCTSNDDCNNKSAAWYNGTHVIFEVYSRCDGRNGNCYVDERQTLRRAAPGCYSPIGINPLDAWPLPTVQLLVATELTNDSQTSAARRITPWWRGWW